MLQNQTLRSILLGTVVVAVLGAYVWHRRSTIQKRSPQANAATAGDQNGGPDGGPGGGPDGGPGGGPDGGPGGGPDGGPGGGPDGGPGGGPGDGPNGQSRGGPNAGPGGGPNNGPNNGVGVGVADPKGRPGLDGPRSQSVCMIRGASGAYRFQVGGNVKIVDPDPNIAKLGKKAVTTVVATNVPVAQWANTSSTGI